MNDIKRSHDFINKVYPHEKLAFCAVPAVLRSEVPVSTAAKIIAFFATKGKRLLYERHILGESKKDDEPDITTAPSDIREILDAFAPDLSRARRDDIVSATTAMLPSSSSDVPVSSVSDEHFKVSNEFLGRTDQAELEAYSNDLLSGGEYHIIAFGHTHQAIDGNETPPFGGDDPRRVFNTGSWIPQINVSQGSIPTWSELATIPAQTKPYYLSIDMVTEPRRACLEPVS